ncbi:MAG: hypothetical protein Ct9H300mP32_6960 [Verrucomicrobiota bacterium]|nr:MAG: hypothetical protein Ct9H300mP32_6960 [Verrucomicrobiota bacterium]
MRTEKALPKGPKIHEVLSISVWLPQGRRELIRVGDPITLNDQFELLRGDLAVARAFDNRVGTWAVAETLRLLQAARLSSTPRCALSQTRWRRSACSARGKLPTHFIPNRLVMESPMRLTPDR